MPVRSEQVKDNAREGRKEEVKMNTVKLNPMGIQKSFYGKARIECHLDGTRILISYSTPVAKIVPDDTCPEGVKFVRLWHGWSATTMRHINAFRAFYGLDSIRKRDWELMRKV